MVAPPPFSAAYSCTLLKSAIDSARAILVERNHSMGTDFAVIGNGAIGMAVAIAVAKKHPDWNISIVAPKDRRFSASAAAGAMVNVYAEIEALPRTQEALANRLLELGKKASAKWLTFLDQTGGSGVVTARETLVVLKKNASTFEERNFRTMSETVLSEGVGSLESAESVRYFAQSRADLFDTVLRIENEFAMDSGRLLAHLDNVARSLNITLIDAIASRVEPDQKRIILSDSTAIESDQIVVAAGAFTGTLFEPEVGLLPMFQGIGTALLTEKFPIGGVRPREVVRTVNRGGAQCGVHLVPVGNDSIYIGAGNTVSSVKAPNTRFETVSYLLETAEKEFFGREISYALEGAIRVGLRPRSLDGFPMIGPLSQFEGVFIATATNRAGLTWAPEIAEHAVRWASGLSAGSELEPWAPDRISLLAGSDDDVMEHYVESRIGAGLEHGLIQNTHSDVERARAEIREAGERHVRLLSAEGGLAGVHPDNWAAATAAAVDGL